MTLQEERRTHESIGMDHPHHHSRGHSFEAILSKKVALAQNQLKQIGYELSVDGQYGPRTRQCIHSFKSGHAHGLPLAHNSKLTWRTMRALRWSVENDGAVSKHFKYRTWKSNGNGEIKVNRRTVRALERLRARMGKPISAFSGYRDPDYNRRIGGASSSQHILALAVDIPIGNGLRLSQVRRLGIFSGIGYQSGTGSDPLIRHVDLRHTGPWNMTRGTPLKPTVWSY